MAQAKFTNALINERSPYLQQHAHNPVQWYGWGDAALSKAREEDKLIIISIGYSTCHWCHVMERESFEDEETAAIMNKYFVCIKVDREERPDIDAVYMDAVQLMTGQGGWPLNCITLPDQQPLYGGTYFPRSQWQQVLLNVANLYKTDRDKCLEYVNELTQGVSKEEKLITTLDNNYITTIDFIPIYKKWSTQFDPINGGANRAPKFPLPNTYSFLLQLLFQSQHQTILSEEQNEYLKKHVHHTLTAMAYGGIYDQLGGGFSRYSTDNEWKVPHFEKMLYDNAQLVSLYSNAYQYLHNDLYIEVVNDTLAFIERELTAADNGFYSALDADSEGVEGKFYVWTKEEIEKTLGSDAETFIHYYNVNSKGYWEHNNYILLQSESDSNIAKKFNISLGQLENIITNCKQKLMNVRDQRIRPGLDDKQICAWNALMLKGYIDAYSAFGDADYLNAAEKNAVFILKHLANSDGGLLRHAGYNGSGFLDDYAFCIDAFIALYQSTLKLDYLHQANQWMDYVLKHFYDDASGLFFYTSASAEKLITRKTELQDNVIPASNSAIAKNLFFLSRFYALPQYEEKAKKMLLHMVVEIEQHTPWYSNWAQLVLQINYPFYEVCVCGPDADKLVLEFRKLYLPNILLAGCNKESELPLLKNRFVKNENLIYVCTNNTCLLPFKSVSEVLTLISGK